MFLLGNSEVWDDPSCRPQKRDTLWMKATEPMFKGVQGMSEGVKQIGLKKSWNLKL